MPGPKCQGKHVHRPHPKREHGKPGRRIAQQSPNCGTGPKASSPLLPLLACLVSLALSLSLCCESNSVYLGLERIRTSFQRTTHHRNPITQYHFNPHLFQEKALSKADLKDKALREAHTRAATVRDQVSNVTTCVNASASCTCVNAHTHACMHTACTCMCIASHVHTRTRIRCRSGVCGRRATFVLLRQMTPRGGRRRTTAQTSFKKYHGVCVLPCIRV